MMYDMVDNPDLLHGIMAIMRDGTLSLLDALERDGLLSLNNDGTYVGSGGLGWSTGAARRRLRRQRCVRSTCGASPRARKLLGFPRACSPSLSSPTSYPSSNAFGLNCYGCCEPLDARWHIVEKIPRLRRVSVSAWANVEKMAEKLGDRHIFSWKPSPADLAMPTIDEDRLREGLRRTFQLTRNCRVEVIMKDNHTIGNNPQNVIRWCQIAREEAERV